ncbi:MAG TPA: prepilin-type N-terminal cleavage/methylation domain-containing protein [Sedimentisphaerales bacterium]|nr:prepilin-type N-terminal cleavage/methylation domain-containing protein [Sedimentisphaerales bacterium]
MAETRNIARAFSLVELLIIVAIIGILAAVVMPTVVTHSRRAKEAAARENLQILRSAIELYAAQHNGIPPGYFGGDVTTTPNQLVFMLQMLRSTDIRGFLGDTGDPAFPYGPYLTSIPVNPLNGLRSIRMVDNTEPFPEPAGKHGFIYQPATKTIRLDTPGNDLQGVPYIDY